MKAILAIALLVTLALAGCTAKGGAQGTEAGNLEELLAMHFEAECAVEIDANGGIHFAVKECAMGLEEGSVEAASMECEGLTGHGSIWNFSIHRKSSFTVAYYTPDDFTSVQSFPYDVEDGNSHEGSCTVTGPTDDFGEYELSFEPSCYDDSNAYFPGLQEQPTKCDFRDGLHVGKEGFL